jgi:hypothetical protein
MKDTLSSKRFKTNVHDMGCASNPIMELRPVTFTYAKTSHIQFGLIAEEVEQVMPELVGLDDEDKPFSVKYHDLPALLLNELQKQAKVIEDLKDRLSEIEEIITGLGGD